MRGRVWILEQSVNIVLKLWPILRFGGNDAASNFTQSISNVLLHTEILFLVNSLKKFDFDEILSFRGQLTPNIGVCGRTKIGKTKSDLRSRKVSQFGWILT